MPCSTYAKGITARMRELEGRLETVERHQEEQDADIEAVNKRVDKTNKDVQKLEKKIEDSKSGSSVLNELRERRLRRKNVVFYGIGEAEEGMDVEEKKHWDRKSCQNIFDALKLRVKASSIKYTRRIGEKGSKPRPLLAGMASEADKEELLENAKWLRNTRYHNIGISADLTPQELQEERELLAEAERRNKDLSQEDKQKNLKWLVVGQKGEKRLLKGVERAPPAARLSLPPSTNSRPANRQYQQSTSQSNNQSTSYQSETTRREGRPNETAQRYRKGSKRTLSDSENEEDARRSNARKKPAKQAPPRPPTASETSEGEEENEEMESQASKEPEQVDA